MSTRVLRGREELHAAVGETLGTGPWLSVDQDRIDGFADVTEDHQWIHVDAERAAAGPFGATIAHGYLTLALIPRLGADIFRIEGARMGINYGLEKVRFPHPVPAGSRVRATATLDAAEETPSGVRAVVTYVIEIDGVAKPACIAQTVRVVVF